jgi:hypothetical protein
MDAESFPTMSGPRYEIDDAGNLIEDGPVKGPSAEELSTVEPEQARRTMRAILLSESAGVLLLLGGAAYYEDSRELLLIASAVYAIVAVVVARYMRRTVYRQVEKGPPA